MFTKFEFRSAKFNCTTPKDYFINPGCYGDDAAVWLSGKLREQNIEVSGLPDQEDFGWFFTFNIQGVEHCIVLAFQPNDPERGDRWFGWIERHVGFVHSILGGRRRGILPAAIKAIDEILTTSADIDFIGWSARTE